MVQVRGVLNRVGGYEVLHTVDTEDVLKADNLADNFEEEREVDFSYVAREVPIEFLYRDYKSIITTSSRRRSAAVRTRRPYGAFLGLAHYPDRRDPGSLARPDSSLCGKTSHLVLSMLQALNTVETVNRLIDLFPSHERAKVRAMLADMLKDITGQRLMQTKDDKGQVTACEIMSVTGRIKDFIMDAN